MIVEEPRNKDANSHETQGIGGALIYICKQLNDLYNGYEFKLPWMKNTTSVVKNDFDSYIILLKKLWAAIQNNERLSSFIPKEELALGYDGTFYKNIFEKI